MQEERQSTRERNTLILTLWMLLVIVSLLSDINRLSINDKVKYFKPSYPEGVEKGDAFHVRRNNPNGLPPGVIRIAE